MTCPICSGEGQVKEVAVYMQPTGKAYTYSGMEVDRKIVVRSCLRCGGKGKI